MGCSSHGAGHVWPARTFPGREWLVLFFPHTEFLAKLGTFQSALLSLGFPPDCWSERKQERRQQRAGQSGPALCLSCPCSSVPWVTTDTGQGGVQEEVSRLELHVEFATDMSGKGHGRHWASASFCDSCRASLGHAVWVCPLRAHSAQSPTSPGAGSLGTAWDLSPVPPGVFLD